MGHPDPKKQRASWRENKRRQRMRVREDARGEMQKQLRESASAGMGGGTLTTCRFDADDSNVRVDPPGVDDWSSVRRVWVPEGPVRRLPDAIERLCVGRQVTMLTLVPALSAPQDWPVFLAAVEAAGVCVLVQKWVRQRQAAVLGFGVDPMRFTAAWQSWGLVLHTGVPTAAAVQQEPPPPSQPRSEPAASEGEYSPWSGAAHVEDVPSRERLITVPLEYDDIARVHWQAFGTDIYELPTKKQRAMYDEIEKLTDRLEDEGLEGTEMDAQAVKELRRRYQR